MGNVRHAPRLREHLQTFGTDEYIQHGAIYSWRRVFLA
jgi:hypothetical protein